MPPLYSGRTYLLVTLSITLAFGLLLLPGSLLARPHTTVGQAVLFFLNPIILFELLFGLNYVLRYRDGRLQQWLGRQPARASWAGRFLLTITLLSGYAVGRYYLDEWLGTHLDSAPLLVHIIQALLGSIIGFSFLLGIEQAASSRHLTLEIESLKRAQLQARYESLKQQLSPHFLFNSLSTLSGLVHEEPDAAERFIGEMARVYRYLLLHGEQPAVPLRAELAFARSYTYLLHTRFGEGLRLQVEVPDAILDRVLPPLALQLLVENAVKHNTLSYREPLVIRIDFVAPATLRVCNPRRPRLAAEASSGQGLRNLTNRVRLLNQQQLLLEQTAEVFCVLLPLPASA